MKIKTTTAFHSGYLALAATLCCLLFGTLAATAGPPPAIETSKAQTGIGANDPFRWTGLYLGLNLGGMLSNYEFGDTRTFVDQEEQFFDSGPFSDDDGVTFFIPHHSDRDGAVIGGGQIGASFQFGHFVAGVEGDFNRTSSTATSVFRGTGTTLSFDVGPDLDESAVTDFSSWRSAETNWVASARLRLGIAQGRFLWYATGGPAWADVRVSTNDVASTNFFTNPPIIKAPTPAAVPPGTRAPGTRFTTTPPVGPRPGSVFQFNQTNSVVGSHSDTRLGWTAGGGVEFACSDTVTLALEYRHNDFGSETHNFPSDEEPIFPVSTHVNLESDQVTVRLNVMISHFGHDSYASTTMAPAGKETMSAKDKNIMLAPAPEPFSWTGLYLGLDVGGGWTDYDVSSYVTDVDVDQQLGGTGLPFSSFVTFDDISAIDHGSDSSLIGGGQLGYNYQWGHFVFGVEGDFNGVGSRKSARFQPETIFSTSNFGFDTETNLLTMREAVVNWVGSARGRFGWAQGSALLYLTGGVAFADTSLRSHEAASTTYFDQGTGAFVFNVTNTAFAQDEKLVTGWTGGAGAEWAVTKIVSMALEYRHNGFGDETYNFSRKGKNGPIFPGATRLGLEEDQVTLRVNFLLGHMGLGH